jgi:hypothetical protein
MLRGTSLCSAVKPKEVATPYKLVLPCRPPPSSFQELPIRLAESASGASNVLRVLCPAVLVMTPAFLNSSAGIIACALSRMYLRRASLAAFRLTAARSGFYTQLHEQAAGSLLPIHGETGTGDSRGKNYVDFPITRLPAVGLDSAPLGLCQSKHGVSRRCVVHEAPGIRT